jgi:hypothetical protein
VIDIKRQNREALRWILDYDRLKTSYINSLAEFSTLAAAVNDGMPKGTDTSRPCQNKAISLVEMERQNLWIQVIELMERTLSRKSKKYLELRREVYEPQKRKTKPGKDEWVGYVSTQYADWLEKEEGVKNAVPPTQQCMCNWMNKIIEVTARLAIKKGIL